MNTKPDTQEVANRRKRLAFWIESKCHNNQAEFLRRLKPEEDAKPMGSGELSLLLRTKPFGEKKQES